MKKFLAPVICVLIGIGLIVLSSFMISRESKINYLPTQATISNIESEYDPAAEDYDYHVFVDYTVNGTEYKDVPLGSYNITMKVGKQIDIEYAENDPSHIQTPGGWKFLYVFMAVGGGFLIAGVVMFIKGRNPQNITAENTEE